MMGVNSLCRILLIVTLIAGCLFGVETWPLGIELGKIIQFGNEPSIQILLKRGFVRVDDGGDGWLPGKIDKTIELLKAEKNYDGLIRCAMRLNIFPDGVKAAPQVSPRMELNIRYLPGTGRIRGYTIMGHVDAIAKNESDQILFCQGAINATPKGATNVVLLSPTGNSTKVELGYVAERLQRQERIWFRVVYNNKSAENIETRMNYEIGYDDVKQSWHIEATCQQVLPGDQKAIEEIKDRIAR